MPQVLIMMATYNGEKYLQEQLDSILAQTHANWELIIQDDGSTDSTLSIIEKYCLTDSRIRLLHNDSPYHGAFWNFHILANRFKKTDHYDFYMFCDQDDIWYKNKIEILLNMMRESDEAPTLVYADMSICDKNGIVIEKSINRVYKISNLSEYSVFFNHKVFGCNMMINKKLFDLIPEVDITKPYVKNLSHDNYCAKYAAVFGKIVFVPCLTMKYRRHGENETYSTYYKTNLFHIIKRVFQPSQLALAHAGVYNQSLITISMMKQCPLSEEQFAILNGVENCIRNGGLQAFYFLKRNHICLGRSSEQLSRTIILVSGLYKKYLLNTFDI